MAKNLLFFAEHQRENLIKELENSRSEHTQPVVNVIDNYKEVIHILLAEITELKNGD